MTDEKMKETPKNKENTIDILVSSKKKETEAEKPTPAPVKQKEEGGKSAPTPGKKKAPAPADRTRAVRPPRPTGSTVKNHAAETRIGSAPVPAAEKSTPAKAPIPKKEKKAKKAPDEKERKLVRRSLRNTAIIAAIYIAVVVGVSAVLAYFGINWANDVFALVKDEVTATVTIPEDATLSEVSEILESHGLIEYPTIFRMYIGFKNRDADPPLAFKAGDYEIKSTLNYDQIVSMIKNRRTRSIVTITIPEGYTVNDIIHLFTSQGIGTAEGFVDAINNYPYEYTFMEKLNEIPLSADRIYRLEGYLFPDTYEFYTDSKEVAIVDKMLAAFEAHFEKGYYDRLAEMGMDLDEIVTLASIVQKEGKFSTDFYPISGVFHNRLNSKSMKKLQSNATLLYVLPEHKEELLFADLEIDNPYNSYKYAGLPPSAICNPGWEAIQAAMYPESHKNYYFISDIDGSTIFAATETQHLKNRAALDKAKETGVPID